jgi:hypothetical protein
VQIVHYIDMHEWRKEQVSSNNVYQQVTGGRAHLTFCDKEAMPAMHRSYARQPLKNLSFFVSIFLDEQLRLMQKPQK